jgi:thiamine pyrophosphokinase
VTIEFFNDFATTSVNSLVDDAMGTYLQLKLIPAGSTVSSTNPSYTMSCFIQQWQPINGSAQDVATASVTWPIKNLTKSTTS